jgi:hypothetical protein
MTRTNRELWLAFWAVLLISGLYLLVVLQRRSVPAGREFFGHSLGILGFLLMLMTETLYSLRKQSRSARWGRLAGWLQFHIFTGLVGPYLVLLHSAWKFNGLAGVLTLLTVIIVASGFIGRYIYTAVPRRADGTMLAASELEASISALEPEIRDWFQARPDDRAFLGLYEAIETQESPGTLRLIFGRSLDELRDRLHWRRIKKRLGPDRKKDAEKMEGLLRQRRTMQRQIASLALARRLLALWHTIHIPIGMALFTVAFFHIGAALYYATLLK